MWLWPAENEAFDLLKDAAAQKILLIITFFSSFFSLIEMLLLAIKAIPVQDVFSVSWMTHQLLW